MLSGPPAEPAPGVFLLQTGNHSTSPDYSSIRPQQTCRWNEQAPERSQAWRLQPGQAQSRVPTIACTRCKCSVQSRPACAWAPQGLQQLTGQTHPFGMATVPPPGRAAPSPSHPSPPTAALGLVAVFETRLTKR